MKKHVFLVVLIFVTFTLGSFAQIKVDYNGYVGINNDTPAYNLDVSGNVRFAQNGHELFFMGYSFGPNVSSSGASLGTYDAMWDELYSSNAFFNYSPTILSDSKYKSNVKDLDSMSQKLKLLRPVTYMLNFNKTQGNQAPKSYEKSEQFGLIAQELQTIFPEMVTTQKDGTLGVRYMELIPVLVKICQEQQQVLESLEERIAKLEKK